MKRYFLLLVLIASTFWVVSNAAMATQLEDLRKKFSLPTHVQLRPFQAPTSRSGRAAPITVFLEAFDKEKIGLICKFQPRIMDVLMSQLYKHPLQVNGRSLDLTGIAEGWLAPINQSLGHDLVKSVYVIQGARSVTKGSSSRLPFNASGCTGIKKIQEQLKR